jgi:hypothetical protein
MLLKRFHRDVGDKSFFAKIEFAYESSVIQTNLRNDLDRLRRIRNGCAHAKFHVNFFTKEISDAIDQLYASKTIGINSKIGLTAKQKFCNAVALANLHLLDVANGVTRQNRLYWSE